MKKYLLSLPIIFVFTLTIFVFNSCQKESNDMAVQPQEQVMHNLGCNLLPEDIYKSLPVAPETDLKALPTLVNLNTPFVGDQGSEGSCVAWGTTYAGRSMNYFQGTTWSYDANIFSPEYVYDQIKVSDCSSGAYVIDGLNLLKNKGACLWATLPYSSTNGCDASLATPFDSYAANYKIAGYSTVSLTMDAIKDQLAAGKAVIVAGPVDRNFMRLASGAVLTKRRGSLGGHCYCVVGYDDSKSAFKFLNSWGTSWATAGYGYIHYSYITQWWQEAYILN
jgi:C1A family cysteine protease